jgi:hypothetical protein
MQGNLDGHFNRDHTHPNNNNNNIDSDDTDEYDPDGNATNTEPFSSRGGDQAPQRISLWQLVKGQWPELLLTGGRLLVFFLLQVFFAEMATSFSSSSMVFKAYPLLDSLAASACCWLLIGGTWLGRGVLSGIWDWCKTPVSRGRFLHSIVSHVFPRALLDEIGVHGVVMRRQSGGYGAEYDDDATPFFFARQFASTEPRTEGTRHMWLDTLPWTIWSCMQSCGLSIFVLGYSLGGMFWLPQHALLLSCMMALLFTALRTPPPAPRRHAFLVGGTGLLLVMLLTLNDHLQDANALGLIAHNFWLGLLVPMGMVWVLYQSRHASLRRADALLSFSMPALLLLSLTYFSLYLPAQECDLYFMQRVTRLVTPYDALHEHVDTLLTSNELLERFFNATRLYYNSLASPSANMLGMGAMMAPESPMGVLALLMAPTLLWMSVVIVLRASLGAPSRLGSTLALYVLALLLRRMHLHALNHETMRLIPLSLGVPVLCVSTFLLLIPELRQLERIRQAQQSRVIIYLQPHMILPSVLTTTTTTT